MIDLIDFKENGFGDVVADHLKIGVGNQLLDISPTARVKVV